MRRSLLLPGYSAARVESTRKPFSEDFKCSFVREKVTITGTTLSRSAPDGELLEFVKLATWCTGMPDCGKLVAQGGGCPFKRAT